MDVELGPAGGTLKHRAGAKIVIPVGAVAELTKFSLCGVAPQGSTAVGGEPLGQGFEAGPSGKTFLKPVAVVVPFDATRLASGASIKDVGVRMAPHGTSSFVGIASKADLATGLVTAKTVHFTQFIPAQATTLSSSRRPRRCPTGSSAAPMRKPFKRPAAHLPIPGVSSRVLPSGFAFSAGGALGGSPTSPGLYAFFLGASSASDSPVQAAFGLTINAPTNAVPTLVSITPATAAQGSGDATLALKGSGFAPTASVDWDGAPVPTAFVDASTLGATVVAANLTAAGMHLIAVTNPMPGGGVSAPQVFTVTTSNQNPVPTLGSVVPTALPVSNVATQIAITGSNFIATTSAAIDMQLIPTLFVSATSLLATLPASSVAQPGTLNIFVENPAPGGGFSVNSIPITVGMSNPVPTRASLQPTSIGAGSAGFTLFAKGSGFVQGGQLSLQTPA